MTKQPLRLVKCLIFLNTVACTGIANARTQYPKTCEITSNSIAKIKLGNSLNQVKAIYPNAQLARATDGDGVALITIKIGGEDLAVLYAGESDPNEKINLSKKIEQIETFNPACKTKSGIHPKASLKKSADLLGGVALIRMSEIEGRQYVEFKKPSNNITYRINYCGDFANDSMRVTNNYLSSCTLLSIAISR